VLVRGRAGGTYLDEYRLRHPRTEAAVALRYMLEFGLYSG